MQALKNERGVAHAHLALSRCCERLNDVPTAMAHLEMYLSVLKPEEDRRSYAEACSRIGKIYFERKQYEQAAGFFDKLYKLAQELRDTRLMDLSRLNLGMARAKASEAKYMKLVKSGDIDTLLAWKLGREKF